VPQSKRPLSVFLLVRSLESGGAERQLVELARGLHERGHAVTIATFYRRGPLIAEVERAGISVVDLEKRGRWEIWRFLFRARKALRRADADVLYSFLGGANVFAAAMRTVASQTKLVWSIRSSDVDLSMYDRLQRLSYRIERLLSATPDLIIANSYSGRDYAVACGFPRNRIEVVANGIDTDRFRPDPILRRKQRLEWGLSNDRIVVGVLARLDPMKGQGDFLNAAVQVAKVCPAIRFVCIGEGPEERRLKRLALELGIQEHLQFTGPTRDPGASLNGLDICCSPSLFGEGFSNSIAEAMACGVPCVVTDVGDSARIVGDLGTVVPRSHPDSLANGILQAVVELPQVQHDRVRARIVANFSVATMVQKTIGLLNQL
jgi:glycosyltransferase involved in cell wall biosynthesis